MTRSESSDLSPLAWLAFQGSGEEVERYLRDPKMFGYGTLAAGAKNADEDHPKTSPPNQARPPFKPLGDGQTSIG